MKVFKIMKKKKLPMIKTSKQKMEKVVVKMKKTMIMAIIVMIMEKVVPLHLNLGIRMS